MAENDYQKMIKDSLERLNTQIGIAKARAKGLAGEAKHEYDRMATSLRDRENDIEAMLKKLDQRKDSKEVKELRSKIDTALGEIQNGVASLISSVDSRLSKLGADRSGS